ncbi:MAG: carbamate kinase [Candidatus Methanofastidiosia archaeon]
MVSTIVVALGGNAIKRADQKGTLKEQLSNISLISDQLAQLVKAGHRIVLTHGNGPQVGSLLIQQEEAKDHVPQQPLDVLGAMTQGQVGYMLQQALHNRLACEGLFFPVVAIVNQVVVDISDEAFKHPTKPVGPFYTQKEAQKLSVLKGWPIKYVVQSVKDGYRRVVPSPIPKRNVEASTVKLLVDSGVIVIASGGGGIPVREANGELIGVEAVIDKDLSAKLLATDIGASILMLMTDVEHVSKHFGTHEEETIDVMTLSEAQQYTKEGHFPQGSMGPKVLAAMEFIKAGGGVAIISSIGSIIDSLDGRTGTRIIYK